LRVIRLWCDDLALKRDSESVGVGKLEAHHFLHVLRSKIGTQVELLDGRGCCAKAVFSDSRNKEPVFFIESLIKLPQRRELVVMCPAPKGKRLPYLLEKLQELGVSAWVPLETDYSVRESVSKHEQDKLQERLKEACKQSGCPWRMEIKESVAFKSVLAMRELVALDLGGQRWDEVNVAIEENVHLLVGPEAGWSDEEREQLIAGKIKRVTLSAYHLRMETAAILGAARCAERELC